MSEKLVLIDGHSILHRAFYGVPDLTNTEGLHTNAIYGFLNIMFKILDEEKAQYLAVAFDLSAPTFRHKIYAEYKGTRKAMPEELREQVPVIKEVLTAMEIPLLQKEGYEADDLLGTIAKRMEKDGLVVSVISGDRDLLQLATDKIKIRIPKTKRTGTEIEDYNTEDVIEKYQVTPQQFIEVKALMGDTSDNVPGLPGVGEKTATKLIVQYGSVENAHAHVGEIKPNKAQQAFLEHYDKAQLSKELVTIDIHSPIDFQLSEAKIGNLYTEAAFTLCKRLEFKNMLQRFECESSTNAIEDYFNKIDDFGVLEAIFKKAQAAKKVGFELLLEGKECYGLGLAFGEEDIYYIQVAGLITADYLVGKLEELLNSGVTAVTMNLKNQLSWLKITKREQVHDLALIAYLINPLKAKYGYEEIADEYLGLVVPSKSELLGKQGYAKGAKVGQGIKDAQDIKNAQDIEDVMTTCACYMSYIAFAAIMPALTKLAEDGMQKLYEEIERPLVYMLYEMERAGILVEANALKVYGEQLIGRIAELEQEIYEKAGEEFNINSPKQLGVILFEKLELPGGKKTKTGYSTAADVLEKLAAEFPIVTAILEYRQLTKLKSTYADGLANHIEEDGRIRSTFNQTITATGRISSTEPNLQNIPTRVTLGRLIRKVFIPKAGYVFVDADYSQIELRVLAAMSEDEMLIKAYLEAKDIHRITASQVFGIPFEEVTDLQRRNAKAVNFGIVYGISSFGLSQDLSITRKAAEEYIEQYFIAYPKIKGFLDKCVSDAKEKGYVTTLFGRRRPMPELTSSNFMQRAFGERVAMNAPIQGTAADIIKIAMIRVNDRLKEDGMKSQLILQVHDELLVEALEAEVEQVKQILQEEMTGAANLAVKLEIDVHTGHNWYEAK